MDYSFNVEIWEEDDQHHWAVCEDFTKPDKKEFVPLGWGVADSYADAAEAAWQVVRDFIA